MRNVIRTTEPDSLRRKASEWTDDLLKAIEDSNNNDTPVPTKFYNRYKKPDVLDNLKRMYGDDDGTCLCCYCESEIEAVSFPQIEHRKPKSIYPESTFDWYNLHLVCEKCNNAKRNKYNEDAPILDAVEDIPIKKHLGYKVNITKGVYRETITDRGITTVEHADLDRFSLLKARQKVYLSMIEAVQRINKLGQSPKVYTAKKILRDKCLEEYGSFIEWVLDEWNI